MSQAESPIKIKVETEYLKQQSDIAEQKFLFTYTITIINTGDQDVTLKDRHWIITDADGNKSEVKGPGVVGETPTIAPNTAYQYSSGTVLDTPIGFMEGAYGMTYNDGKTFSAPIPTFRLSVPGILQ
ncbi:MULTISPECIES: Co2+/Mg2+ efflux protein ApaG [Shewanella]|jgi:ApaG protein|uniref:Protein ApaG n=1 Tax=Shewanella holmiensis TaxID=2952222 RepID=A0A9X2WKD8_9GAMM|nr:MULTISPECIES: Co2+/Mg2+ efflux protein ApaG [Shewanella]MCT7940933.1 Co2+/Mg2+ efflux protein ApaG [Shewanella holmiensis]MDP5146186.1 Co2+/Mg2+ efflux protein ApaG [Shewanella sp. ULN5]